MSAPRLSRTRPTRRSAPQPRGLSRWSRVTRPRRSRCSTRLPLPALGTPHHWVLPLRRGSPHRRAQQQRRWLQRRRAPRILFIINFHPCNGGAPCPPRKRRRPASECSNRTDNTASGTRLERLRMKIRNPGGSLSARAEVGKPGPNTRAQLLGAGHGPKLN